MRGKFKAADFVNKNYNKNQNFIKCQTTLTSVRYETGDVVIFPRLYHFCFLEESTIWIFQDKQQISKKEDLQSSFHLLSFLPFSFELWL